MPRGSAPSRGYHSRSLRARPPRPGGRWLPAGRRMSALYLSYVAPLAAIGPLASAVWLSVTAYPTPVAGHAGVAFGNSITQAVVTYVSSLIGIYVLAVIIERLTPFFSGWEDQRQAFKLAAYSSTPALLAGGFRLIPALDFLVLLGFYSLYLLYLGAPVLMRVPQQNVVGYAATVIVAAAAIFFVISVIGGWF